jgi:uncharacterized protein YbaP (TraB family)
MRAPIIVVFFSRIFFSLFFCQLLLASGPALAAERGALFKATANGHTLHLFGTIHAGLPDFYPLEPRIQAAVMAAPTLALEIDAARDLAAVMAAMREHGMFAPGSAGVAGLSAERRARIQSALKKAGVDLGSAAQLRPWMLITMLGMMEVAKLGYQAELGVDLHLAQLARAGKTRITELESAQYQAALFNSIPLEQQWRLLEETLEMIAAGTHAQETRELVEAYDRADRVALDRIAQRLETDRSLTGKYTRELLLDQRNGPMADKVAALLARENNAVVAVGLLHLLGKRGLPELLRARGITVERVY